MEAFNNDPLELEDYRAYNLDGQKFHNDMEDFYQIEGPQPPLQLKISKKKKWKKKKKKAKAIEQFGIEHKREMVKLALSKLADQKLRAYSKKL